jgi:hypothetical protein
LAKDFAYITRLIELDKALQRYGTLQPGSEFRCFIRDKNLIGICSRETSYQEDLQDRVDSVWEQMLDFVTYQIILKCPLNSFVVDIYLKIDKSYYIFDFSPFSPPTDSLYFSWEELMDEKFGEEVDFRYNDGKR